MLDHIHQSNLIEGIDNEQADKDCLAAWERLQSYDVLTDYVVQLIQRMITQHQDDLKPEWRGKYRTIPVWIGGNEALPYWLIKDHMTAWLYRTNEINWSSAMEGHVAFEKIHPFVDGNGRTGRMLMWWHERKLGLEPTLITYADRQNYYGNF